MKSVLQNRRLRRTARRGASLLELLIVMSAATVILTITAALVHRVMLAHSKARAFVDIERTSLRLANAFRSDVHQAIAASIAQGAADGAAFLKLELPADQRIEYRRDGGIILRILLDSDRIASREAFTFPSESEVAIKKDGPRLIALSINSRADETTPTDSTAKQVAYSVPVNLYAEAALNRDSPSSQLGGI